MPDKKESRLAPMAAAAEAAAEAAFPRMGGIALKNGLILVSERHWAAAIRDAAGMISVASGLKPRVPVGAKPDARERAAGGVPVLRGLGRFAETLMVLAQTKMNLPGAELPLEGSRIVAALAGALGANAAVRVLAPRSPLIQEVGGALAAFVPAVLALKNSSISGYHGAEHKVIGGGETIARRSSASSKGADRGYAGSAAARAAAAGAASKEHDRCGSNLVGPYLAATVLTNLLARGRSGRKSPAASAVAGAASLGLALEALRWATTHGDNMLAKLMLYPGRLLQKQLTTAEPTADQLEVGQRAMDELLRLEGATG